MVVKRMELLGEIARIWRYPVKSLAPQPIPEAIVTQDGIPGDRSSALFVESGHARAGKTYRGKEHNLLHTVDDPEQARGLAAGRGVNARVAHGDHFFDAAPISLIFDRWVDEVAQALSLDLDPLRWRPNLYARAAAGSTFKEHDLVGALIEAGTALLRVREPIERCVTTTYDQRTGESNPAVLRYVAQERGSMLGVYCEVEVAGTVREGDGLRLRAR